MRYLRGRGIFKGNVPTLHHHDQTLNDPQVDICSQTSKLIEQKPYSTDNAVDEPEDDDNDPDSDDDRSSCELLW